MPPITVARAKRGKVTPLSVASEAARAAQRTAQIAKDVHRHQQATQARSREPSKLVNRPSELEREAELDAIDDFFDELDAGKARAKVDVFLIGPLPPGIKRRKWLGSLEDLRSIPDNWRELVRIVQAAGTWGDVELQLGSKRLDPLTRKWAYKRHAIVALHVPRA